MDTQHDLLVGRRWRAHSTVVHAACTHGRVGLTDWFSICCSIAWFTYWLLFLCSWKTFLSHIKAYPGFQQPPVLPSSSNLVAAPCVPLEMGRHHLWLPEYPESQITSWHPCCSFISSFTTALPRGGLNNCSCQLERIVCSCLSRTIGGQPLTTSVGWAACDLLLYIWCFHARKWNRCSNILTAFALYLPAKYLRCEDGNLMSSLNNCWRQVMILVMLQKEDKLRANEWSIKDIDRWWKANW